MRTPKPVGTCWCGGRLYKDGNSATRCASCDRVRYISAEERTGLRRQLDTRRVVREREAEARRKLYFK
jgi:hypothetical protein